MIRETGDQRTNAPNTHARTKHAPTHQARTHAPTRTHARTHARAHAHPGAYTQRAHNHSNSLTLELKMSVHKVHGKPLRLASASTKYECTLSV